MKIKDSNGTTGSVIPGQILLPEELCRPFQVERDSRADLFANPVNIPKKTIMGGVII